MKNSNSSHPKSTKNQKLSPRKNSKLKQDHYQGQLLENQKHGQGIYYLNPNHVYKGQFAFNKKEGYGELKTPKFTYVGHWKNDLKHGIGKKIYANGDMYKGHFQSGFRHGFGMLKKGNMFFTGFWDRDIKHGEFIGFSIETGEALEIIYQQNEVVSVSKMNELVFSNNSSLVKNNSQNSGTSEIKNVLCKKIRDIETFIRLPNVHIQDKPSNSSSLHNTLNNESRNSFYQGFYSIEF